MRILRISNCQELQLPRGVESLSAAGVTGINFDNTVGPLLQKLADV